MDPPSELVPTATGDFVKTPLAHVVVFMADKKRSGSLVLREDNGSASILYFASGAPSKVYSSYPGTYLGRVLLQLGYIDDELLEASWSEAEATGELHGQVLRTLGAIDDAQLVAALREQVMRRLLKIFEKAGETTTYAFYANVNLLADYGGPDLTPIDPYRVVWEGMHMRPNDQSIDPTLARLGAATISINAQASLRRFGFGPAETKVIEMLSMQPMSLSQVIELGSMPVRQVKLLLYVLLIAKCITVAPARPAVTTSAPPMGDAPSPSGESSAPSPMPRSAPAPAPESDSPQSAPVARLKLKKAVAYLQRPSSAPPTITKGQILDRAQHIESENYFDVLGVDKDAPPNVVQSAYFSLAKLWHPDRLPESLADVRDVAAKVFARMSEAHRTLTDLERRASYLAALDKGAEAMQEQAKVQKVIDATIEYQKAEVYMRKRDFVNALRSARKAYDDDPEQAHYIALYAWLLSQQPDDQKGKNPGTSLLLFDRAVELNPLCEQAFFYRAMLLKQQGKSASALRDFRKVVELNPRNVDASREVRFATMRGGVADQPDDKAAAQRPTGKSSFQDIDWSKDSVVGIFEKLIKRRTPNRKP